MGQTNTEILPYNILCVFFLYYCYRNPISDIYTSFIQCVKSPLYPSYSWKINNYNDTFCILSALEADFHMSIMSNLKIHLSSRELLIMPEHAISSSPPTG